VQAFCAPGWSNRIPPPYWRRSLVRSFSRDDADIPSTVFQRTGKCRKKGFTAEMAEIASETAIFRRVTDNCKRI
jgi:hypothetical protein